METLVLRFPLLGRKIFNKLSIQDMIKSKEVSKLLNTYLESDRLYWTRVLQKYGKKHVEFKGAWISVTKTLPVQEMKELAQSCHFKKWGRDISFTSRAVASEGNKNSL